MTDLDRLNEQIEAKLDLRQKYEIGLENLSPGSFFHKGLTALFEKLIADVDEEVELLLEQRDELLSDERDIFGVTTAAVGEEGDLEFKDPSDDDGWGGIVTTDAVGEEDDVDPVDPSDDEGWDGIVTTAAVGEEDAVWNAEPDLIEEEIEATPVQASDEDDTMDQLNIIDADSFLW